MGTSVAGQLNDDQKSALPNIRDAMAAASAGAAAPTRFTFVAFFDGTNNDRSQYAPDSTIKPQSGDPFPTNVANLYELAKRNETDLFQVSYRPGIGTGDERGGKINAGVAPNAPANAIAEGMYQDFRKAAVEYLDANPNATIEDISATVVGGSRGGAVGIKFMQMVDEQGLVRNDGTVLAPPHSIPIINPVLLDPVGRFVDGDLSLPPNVRGPVLSVQAADENRSDFRPLDFTNDERVTTVVHPGNHVGILGGYDQGGTASNVLEGVTAFMQNTGQQVADVPVEQRFDPTQETKLYTEAYQVDTQGNVLTNEDGSPRYAWKVDDPAQGRQLDSPQHPEAPTEEQLAANSAALLSTLASMAHWSQMTDVQRAASFSALYNTVDHMNNGELAGDLGGAASALSFVSALQHGNAGSVLVSGVSLANALGENFASKEIASAMGVSSGAANVVPGLSLALAIDSGNSMSMVAAAANFIPVYGPLISVGISLLGSSVLGGDEPPPPEGAAHFSWDASGHIQHTVDYSITGGGEVASRVAVSVQTLLQNLVDAHNAKNASTADDIAINPYCLPSIHFKADWGGASVQIATRDGHVITQNLNDKNFGSWLVQTLQDTGGLAPAWQVQTVQAHVQQQRAAGVDESEITRQAGITATVGAHAGDAAYSVQGNAAESADFKSQTFGALVVHLNDNPNVQAAQTQLTNVLRDVESDGYLEQTQAVAAQDSAGNLQAVLTIDFNGDGVIQTRDILNVGGNAAENISAGGQQANANADLQRNNVAWLDANGDGVLDKSDPSFAAIRLWVDVNQDGAQAGNEASSLADMHISSINFKTGEVTYEDGHTDALTAQTLRADTEGMKLSTTAAGTFLEHEGYQGEQLVTDLTGTHWRQVREQTFEQQATRTGDWEGTAEAALHRHGGGNVAGAPTQTTATGSVNFGPVKTQANVITQSTLEEGNVRVVSDAPTQAPISQNNAQTTVAAGDSRIKSNVPNTNASSTSNTTRLVEQPRVVFVPISPATAQNETQAVTDSMIESSQSVLFGATTNVGLGVLTAVSLGVTQSAQAAAQRVVVQGDVATSSAVPTAASSASPVITRNTFSTSTSTGSTALSGRTVTFKQVDLGVFNVPPTVQAFAPNTTAQNSSASSVVSTSAEPPSPAFVYAPVIASASAGAIPDGVTNSAARGPTPLSLGYPVVQAEIFQGSEDVVLRLFPSVLLANDSTPNASADPTQPALTITAVSAPLHGQVSLVNGEVLFAPDANFHGTARFTYTVTDQYGLSTTGTVTLEIAAVNDAPVTQGEQLQSDEDVGLIFTQTQLLGNDSDVDTATDGQVLSISRVGQAEHGTVWLDARGDLRFVPDVNYHGFAQFTYWVSDGAGAETPATVRLMIASVNDSPVAMGETISENEDTTLVVSQAALLQNDSDVDVATDGQVLSITAVSNATHGTVTLNADGSISFVPEANFYGNASFDYTVNDGNGGTATATATIALANVNDAPVATGESINGNEDDVLTITASALLQNDSDIDNPRADLVISRVQSGTGGSVSLNANGNVVFTPTANYNGAATFTYWVKDPSGLESNAVTTTVVLAAVNDAPTVQGEIVTGASEDAVFNISQSTLLLNDYDIDDPNSALSLGWVGNAQHGHVSLDANGDVVFTPDANFNGNATFQYKVRDAAGLESAVVQAVIPVAAVNDAPLAVDDQFTTYKNSTMTVAFNQLTSNDTDIDQDALTVSAVRDNANGHASIVNGQVQFVANAGFTGQASFDYLADDGHGGQTWATALIDVRTPPNEYPTVVLTGTNFFGTGGPGIDVAVASWYLSDDSGIASFSLQSYSVYRAYGGGFSGPDSWSWGNLSDVLTMFNNSATGMHWDWRRYAGIRQLESTWVVTDDNGLSNTWHFNYDINQGVTANYMEHTGYYIPPVILDLNGDGVHYTSLQASNVKMDVNFDGIQDRMAWAGKDDGVLVWDKDHNHKITDASEFAFQTLKASAQTDLEGLQALDANGDGLLDAADDRFAEFGVWQDANGNGLTDAGEFKTLTELGIASINLHSDGQMHDAGTPLPHSGSGETDATVMGNTTFTRTDGSTGVAADTMLAYEPGHAAQATEVDVNAALQVLDTVAADAQRAEVMRQALLFNQVCNTAVVIDTNPLGFSPIEPDVQLHDMLAASQVGLQPLAHAA